MKKFLSFSLILCIWVLNVFANSDITGFWRTIDENTGKARSVVAIYEHEGKYYGRIVVTFDDNTPPQIKETLAYHKETAPGVLGHPPYVGLDFIWNLRKNGDKYTNGRIMDPEKGKIYDAKLWKENGNLIVRGELFIFGRNQTWVPAQESDFVKAGKPNPNTFTPKIPAPVK